MATVNQKHVPGAMTEQDDDPFAMINALAKGSNHRPSKANPQAASEAPSREPAFTTIHRLNEPNFAGDDALFADYVSKPATEKATSARPISSQTAPVPPAISQGDDGAKAHVQDIPLIALSLDPDQPRGVLAALLPRQMITHPIATIQSLQLQANEGDMATRCALAEIVALAEDIATHGLLQPIAVVDYTGTYKVLFGERRALAYAYLHIRETSGRWERIPARVYTLDQVRDPRIAWSENIQRRDIPVVVLMQLLQRLYKDLLAEMRGQSDYYAVRERLSAGVIDQLCHRYAEHTGTPIAPNTAKMWLRIIKALDPDAQRMAIAMNCPFRNLLSIYRLPPEEQRRTLTAFYHEISVESPRARDKAQKSQRKSSPVVDRHLKKLDRFARQFAELNKRSRRLGKAIVDRRLDPEPLIQSAERLREMITQYITLLRNASSIGMQ